MVGNYKKPDWMLPPAKSRKKQLFEDNDFEQRLNRLLNMGVAEARDYWIDSKNIPSKLRPTSREGYEAGFKEDYMRFRDLDEKAKSRRLKGTEQAFFNAFRAGRHFGWSHKVRKAEEAFVNFVLESFGLSIPLSKYGRPLIAIRGPAYYGFLAGYVGNEFEQQRNLPKNVRNFVNSQFYVLAKKAGVHIRMSENRQK